MPSLWPIFARIGVWLLKQVGFIKPPAPDHDSGAPEGASQNKGNHR